MISAAPEPEPREAGKYSPTKGSKRNTYDLLLIVQRWSGPQLFMIEDYLFQFIRSELANGNKTDTA
jgi:hypothetical protein